MTNADRIRAMTDEEMAAFFSSDNFRFCFCEFCEWNVKGCLNNEKMNCANGMENWLKQEVEEKP